MSRVKLKEHLEALRADDQRALAAAFAAADKAVGAALEAVRSAAAQADSVTERRLVEAKNDLEQRLDALNKLKAEMATKADLQVLASEVRAIREALASEAKALRDLITKLESRFDRSEASTTGRATGLKDYVGWIVGGVGVLGVAVSIVIALTSHR